MKVKVVSHPFIFLAFEIKYRNQEMFTILGFFLLTSGD
jgi:hypothetical protein